VSKAVDEKGVAAAYRAVHPVLRQMPVPWFSLSELKLVGVADPVAADVLDIRRRFPDKVPTHTRRPYLGDMAIEEAYVYPQVTGGMTRDEVLRAVAGLMNRSGQVPPATITLRDGSTVRGVPVSVTVEPAGKVRISVHDPAATGSVALDADDVVRIQ